jgi:hypothetical protein
MAKQSKRTLIKEDLLQQLEGREMNQLVYVDLIDKYMALWDAAKDLEKEWKKGKRMIEWDNGGGQSGVKPNPAGKEYRETVKIMTDLLKKMNLDKPKEVDEDEDI